MKLEGKVAWITGAGNGIGRATALRFGQEGACVVLGDLEAGPLEQAAGEAGVRVLDLLSDAYAEEVDSYLELMRFDLRQLQEGLGGD